MPEPNLQLPQALIDLDESLLPQECRDKIAKLVARGFSRKHMMVSICYEVHISEELAMLHPDEDDEADEPYEV